MAQMCCVSHTHTHTLAHGCHVLITNALEMREAAWGGRPCRTRYVSFSPPGHLNEGVL